MCKNNRKGLVSFSFALCVCSVLLLSFFFLCHSNLSSFFVSSAPLTNLLLHLPLLSLLLHLLFHPSFIYIRANSSSYPPKLSWSHFALCSLFPSVPSFSLSFVLPPSPSLLFDKFSHSDFVCLFGSIHAQSCVNRRLATQIWNNIWKLSMKVRVCLCVCGVCRLTYFHSDAKRVRSLITRNIDTVKKVLFHGLFFLSVFPVVFVHLKSWFVGKKELPSLYNWLTAAAVVQALVFSPDLEAKVTHTIDPDLRVILSLSFLFPPFHLSYPPLPFSSFVALVAKKLFRLPNGLCSRSSLSLFINLPVNSGFVLFLLPPLSRLYSRELPSIYSVFEHHGRLAMVNFGFDFRLHLSSLHLILWLLLSSLLGHLSIPQNCNGRSYDDVFWKSAQRRMCRGRFLLNLCTFCNPSSYIVRFRFGVPIVNARQNLSPDVSVALRYVDLAHPQTFLNISLGSVAQSRCFELLFFIYIFRLILFFYYHFILNVFFFFCFS